MKKQKKVLKLDRETLRHLSERDFERIRVDGGVAGPTCSCTGCDTEQDC